MMTDLTVPAIGIIHTPYGGRFGVPRQSGLVPDVKAVIEFFSPYSNPQACTGLEDFSHIYVLFAFDRIAAHAFRPMVRPPRLGGNRRGGVFASRSPFRPSGLGLSVLELGRVVLQAGQVQLEVYGADMTDGTPIIDVKPYLPFVDSIPGARCGYAAQAPQHRAVEFDSALEGHPLLADPMLRGNVARIISCDPRPAYRGCGTDERVYTATLYGYEVGFCMTGERLRVIRISG